MNHWIMKSEPDAFSIDDLQQRPNKTESWDGVRNYQARNMLRDDMKVGDLAFFYHSSCKIPGIAGIIKIIKKGYADSTAFDSSSKYFDSKSTLDNPIWYQVDIKFVKKFKRIITLNELKIDPALKQMQLLKKGNRLSIMPITVAEWNIILDME